VVSQEINGFGTIINPPLFFHWRWCYHFPTWSLWGLIVLLLVVPKSNRHRQAWSILIPLILILLFWNMMANLPFLSTITSEMLSFLVVTGAMAWCCVWIAGHWLSSRQRYLTFFLIFALMMVLELLSYYSRFSDDRMLPRLSIYYGLSVSVLPLSMLLTCYIFSKRHSPLRIIIPWMIGIAIMSFGLAFSVAALSVMSQPDLSRLWAFIIRLLPVGAIFAGMIYLVNLPFMILASRNSFYRQRFEQIFTIPVEGPRNTADSGHSPVTPQTTNPTQKHAK
jgi:hypothetical protein